MATLIDAPEFTANEIYAIQQTDPVEGAAAEASFAGIGVSNQPHQQLANRTAFLKQRQDININSIAALQEFVASFTSNLSVTGGWFTLAQNDQSRGAVSLMVQYGIYPNPINANGTFAFNWSKSFPNICLWAGAVAYNPTVNQAYGQSICEIAGWTTSGGVINIDLVGNSSGISSGIPGFVWLSIGF
jgi:hypothetical protein